MEHFGKVEDDDEYATTAEFRSTKKPININSN